MTIGTVSQIMTPTAGAAAGVRRVIGAAEPRVTPDTLIEAVEPAEWTWVVGEQGVVLGHFSALDLARALKERMAAAAQSSMDKLLLSTFEDALDAIVVVDANGVIIYLNRAYEVILGVRRDEAIGRHVTAVIPGSRMHIVARSGIPEVGRPFFVAGREYIVERHPIFDGELVIGAIGRIMFRSVADLKMMVDRLDVLQKKVEYYERELNRDARARFTFEDIVGSGPAMTALKGLARRAALSNSTVLILGESGTGKELLAHAIHSASRRASGPFVKVNCAAIPKDLLESELFGYEAGAFSGALKGGKPGKFEQANRGTIFLDEIADMTLEMQAKVLRAIQEREIQKVGGTRDVHVDVRIVAATNQDLLKMVEAGQFREDLYYRLAVIELNMPALRERSEDIPALVRSLMERTCREAAVEVKGVTADAQKALQDYTWPGNVRELVHTLERLVNTVEHDLIDRIDLPPYVLRRVRTHRSDDHPPTPASGALPLTATAAGRQPGAAPADLGGGPLKGRLSETGRDLIIQALRQAGGNKLRAAEILGIHRSVLYRKMKQWEIAY